MESELLLYDTLKQCPESSVADPDPALQFDADPDPITHIFPDSDPAMLQNDPLKLPPFHFDADPYPDPAFQFDADADQAS